MINMPPFPRKIRTQAIFDKITTLKPDMNCVLRWKIARIVYESIDQHWPSPIDLRYRLQNMTNAANLLREHGLPDNTGNLKEHAFATCLRAYNWLEQLRIKARAHVDVTPVDVQKFAALMGFHYSDFRRLGCTSYVCQGYIPAAVSALSPTPAVEEIMEVIDGIIGIQAGLMAAVDCDGMSMEEVGVFVRNTPNGKKGEALWLEFTSRRDQPDQAEDYNFVTFMREVIDEAKLPA